MWKKSNKAVEMIIGRDTRISGDIQFVNNALINGYLEGNVKATRNDSKLTINEHGRVKGSVVVPNLLVHGTIEGQVCVAERLKLGPKARVIGDVQYNLLQISSGAQVEGKLVRKSGTGVSQEDKKAEAKARQAHGETAPGKTLSADRREPSAGKSTKLAADIVGVGHRSVQKAKRIEKKYPELAARVESDEIAPVGLKRGIG